MAREVASTQQTKKDRSSFGVAGESRVQSDKGSRKEDASGLMRGKAGKLLTPGKLTMQRGHAIREECRQTCGGRDERRDSKDGTRRPAERAGEQQRDFTDTREREGFGLNTESVGARDRYGNDTLLIPRVTPVHGLSTLID